MFLLPCPEHKDIKRYKISLLLAFFLVVVYLLIDFNQYKVSKLDFTDAQSTAYLNIQAKLYQRHLANLKNFKTPDQRLIASVLDGKSKFSDNFFGTLSRVATLDATFDPLSVSATGLDEVEYADWLEVHSMIKQNLKLTPVYLLGINDVYYGWDRWVSYMFVHVGFFHLFSNVVFLILFGALVETLFGGVVVTLVFFGSGFLAAPIYMYLNELNQISLVGASGGVCGLIAFYSVFQFKEKIRFFYWVLPIENYYGFLFLSSGYILFLWIIGDLAGYLSGVTFLDSVAYSAHLGGFFVGTLCALGLRAYYSFGRKLPAYES
jgi:membrane associated rhomboid family serine protease